MLTGVTTEKTAKSTSSYIVMLANDQIGFKVGVQNLTAQSITTWSSWQQRSQ